MPKRKIESILMAMIVILSIGIALVYEASVDRVSLKDLWILVIVIAAVIIFSLIRNMVKAESDSYEIINPILLIFALYALMLPLNYLVSLSVPTFTIDIPGKSTLPIFQYCIICLLGLTGLLAGYYLPFGKRLAQRLPVLSISVRELKITAVILMIYGLTSFATNVAGYGGFSNFISVGYGPQRYVIQREAVAFGHGMELIGIASIVALFVYLKEKKKMLVILYAAILIALIYISLLIGQRRYIAYLLIIVFLLINYSVFKVKLRWSLIAIIIGYTFFFIYAHTRGLWAEFGVTQGITTTFNLAIQNPEFLLPFAGGEFIPPAKVILEMLTDPSFQYNYGASYLIGLIRIIPRIGKLLPETLLTLSEWRMKAYYPGLWERGVNFIFFTTAEGYANFGFIGAFLHMAVYGFLAKSAYSYFIKNRENYLVLIVYAIVFCMMSFEGIHAEFSQVLWYSVHTYLGPFLGILILLKLGGYVSKRLMISQENTSDRMK